MDWIFLAPMDGRLVDMKNVPDSVFSRKIMGEGFAIDPNFGEVVSPVTGTVVSFMSDTRHAVGILSEEGIEILIHVGIDTVQMGGAGFCSFVRENESVTAGQTLIRFDLDFLKGRVSSLISPIVFTNLPAGFSISVVEGSTVKRGEQGFFTVNY